MQIVEWYDELVALTDSPVVRLNRAVAVGQADGPRAGLAALAAVDPAIPRYRAAAAFLHERAGDLVMAARLYVEAAEEAPNLAERDHLTRYAARLNQILREQEAFDKNSPSGRLQSFRDRPPGPAAARRADHERERRD